MKYYIYSIKSKSRDWIYIGMTEDLNRRLDQHQKGQSKSTAPYRPFCLIFYEEYSNSTDARRREKYLKSASGKRYIRKRYSEKIADCA